MRTLFLIWMSIFSLSSHGEELRVRVREISDNAVLISMDRSIAPSLTYRITKGEIIFTGKKSDITAVKQIVSRGTLMPLFADAYQFLSPVAYGVSFQIRDLTLLINVATVLNCRASVLRQSQCGGGLSYYSSPTCRLSPEVRSRLESALKITTSLEEAKLLKVVTDNPCLNPRFESLYDFALKDLSHHFGIGDFDGLREVEYQAYLVTEKQLELI